MAVADGVFDTLPPFLAKFGYAAQSGSTWQVISEDGSRPPSELHPRMELRVPGHKEERGHTLYEVSGCLTVHGWPQVRWQVRHRLRGIRDALHDPLKAQLGETYEQYFCRAPFAKKGGPPGTTARLDAWCSALAACVNARGCSPSTLALVLHFLKVPFLERGPGSPAAGAEGSFALNLLDCSPQAPSTTTTCNEDDAELLVAEAVAGHFGGGVDMDADFRGIPIVM